MQTELETFQAMEIRLRRNCSARPSLLITAFGVISVISAVIGLSFFLFLNVPWVLFYSVLEISALFLAFYVYSKHAVDYETIILTKHKIIVEKEIGGLVSLVYFDRIFAKSSFENKGLDRIVMQSPKNFIKFGRLIKRDAQLNLSEALTEFIRFADLERLNRKTQKLLVDCGATSQVSFKSIVLNDDTYAFYQA
jgi:hypothetical protein